MEGALKSNPVGSGALYIAVGDLEHSQMRENVAAMVDTLQAHAPGTIRWEYSEINHHNHRSTAGSGLTDGLAWMYRNWAPTEAMARQTLNEALAVHDSLAEFLLRRLGDPVAALTAYKIAQHYYPESDEPRQMILLPEPWLAGGADALRASLRSSDVRKETALDLINVLQSHGHDDLAIDMRQIAAEFFPEAQ